MSDSKHGGPTSAADKELPMASIGRIALTRRRLLLGAGAAAGGLGLVRAWPTLSTESGYQPLLDAGERFGQLAQRSLLKRSSLAPEYRADQLSPNHPSNGGIGSSYVDPNPAFDQMALDGFRSWRLEVGGLVTRTTRFSLDDVRSMPTRTQITMHSCDEGWSAIGQWTGVPLGWLLGRVGILASAKFVVFHALDTIGGTHVFDSIDLFDAFHSQTILAHRFNGESLPVRHGAPLRLRVELQIGYKNIKHISRIEVVDSLKNVGNGHGGLFQQFGYQWYAGQ